MNPDYFLDYPTPPVKKENKPAKLFHFTPGEEAAICKAKRLSAKFMKTYGQAPVQPLIDLSHYENQMQTQIWNNTPTTMSQPSAPLPEKQE